MSDSFRDLFERRAALARPSFQVALVLSLLIHAAALWRWPLDMKPPSVGEDERKERGLPLVVQLAPPPVPPARSAPPPAPAARQAPPERPAVKPAAKPAARPRAEQPVIALAKPEPDRPAAPKQTPVPATQPARPTPGDLSSYIEARRRARGEPAEASVPSRSAPQGPAPDDENARANRLAAANVGANRTPTFGGENRSGGIFAIQRVTHDYAEFAFHGWNKDIRRNATQVIEVRRGTEPDICIAVVRRMISIIRDYEKENFLWESQRLGRYLTLSARLRDNAGLEDFMMREFFEGNRAQCSG